MPVSGNVSKLTFYWRLSVTNQVFIFVRAHLPEEEVAETHLSGGADEQIRIGRIIAVQALIEQRL